MNTAPFHSQTVPLKDSNLIEASAGTGKTYSIAILTLRLLLERRIPIQEILMVTFTKAAVAELETRIRLFVRLAYQASTGKAINDATIIGVVNSAINAIGVEETQQLLKNAVLFLDETSVLTIHSFCQRMLKEYSFETNQIFGAEAMDESAFQELKNDQMNQFWRRKVVVLPKDLLKHLMAGALSRKKLSEIITNELGGKRMLVIEPAEKELFTEKYQQKILQEIEVQGAIISDALAQANEFLELNKDYLMTAVMADRYAKVKFPDYFNNFELLIEQIRANASKKYIEKIFGDVLLLLEPIEAAEEEMQRILDVFANKIYQQAISEICHEIRFRKDNNSMLTFDDMIDKLHDALVIHPSEKLMEAMRKKYLAVFIDEFQDTDKKQYEIFNTLFGKETILFFIGDPKQSIYSWRKADLSTYLKAGEAVLHRYDMDVNYRSNEAIIEAQNQFFKPTEDFDAFYVEASKDDIEYKLVKAAKGKDAGNLLFENNPVKPMTVFTNKNKDETIDTVVANIIQLLSNDNYRIEENGKKRIVKPSDIGILVRKNTQGKAIKEKLSHFRIPAITIDETKLSETEEAREMLFLLHAVIDITASNINKALLTGITGISIADLEKLAEEEVLQQFKSYQYTLTHHGVYVMLMKFLTDYKVKSNLLEVSAINGERRLSNILQLLEILHKKQTRSHFTPVELVNWLQRTIEGQSTEGDEFEQRMESDEDAIKIITIHKSKGLEYNIVFAPFLELKIAENDFSGFRNTVDGQYVFGPHDLLDETQVSLFNTQQEQENRRLIYVAITRAKYKCYINKSTAAYHSNSSLKPFMTALTATAPACIEFAESPEIPNRFIYNSNIKHFPIVYNKAPGFTLSQVNWRRLSYTFLNPDHEWIPKIQTSNTTNAFDDFVFRKLRKGAFTGNLLHYIFEYINFSDEARWDKVIANALLRLSAENKSEHGMHLKTMLQHVMQAKLHCGTEAFTLSEVRQENRLSEFEFDFTVAPFKAAQINSLATPETPFKLRSFEQLEGIMNGKVDLFFEKDGRYFILDWKSNYLGDSLEDYSQEKIWEAMSENNYHLQYHIYTLALCKYLALKIPDFDYEKHFGGVIYLFVRGVRASGDTGIFYHKPAERIIQKLSACFTEST